VNYNIFIHPIIISNGISGPSTLCKINGKDEVRYDKKLVVVLPELFSDR